MRHLARLFRISPIGVCDAAPWGILCDGKPAERFPEIRMLLRTLQGFSPGPATIGLAALPEVAWVTLVTITDEYRPLELLFRDFEMLQFGLREAHFSSGPK